MNDPSPKQPPPGHLVDALIQTLAAKLEKLEAKAARQTEEQTIPPDVPRFVTTR